MSARQPRFEVVRGDSGYWARFIAANGKTVWTTETYRRRRTAEDAVYLLSKPAVGTRWESAVRVERRGAVEVRHIDERATR